MDCVSTPAHQKSFLLAHAWEVHHAHSHVESSLEGGTHALHLFRFGHTALAHAAEEAFLGCNGAVHAPATVLKVGSHLAFSTSLDQFSARLLNVQKANPADFALSKRSFLSITASGAPPFAILMVSATSNPRNLSASANSAVAFSNLARSGLPWLVTIMAFFPGLRRELKPASINEYSP